MYLAAESLTSFQIRFKRSRVKIGEGQGKAVNFHDGFICWPNAEFSDTFNIRTSTNLFPLSLRKVLSILAWPVISVCVLCDCHLFSFFLFFFEELGSRFWA